MKPRYLLLFALLLAGCEFVGTDSGEEQTPTLVLPTPSGTLAVGTTTFYLSDASRDDGYTDAVGDARELMVQLWYPTDAPSSNRASYMGEGVAAILAATQDYVSPAEMQSLVASLRTNSFEQSPVSALGPFPVVFLSHGLTGIRSLYTVFAEDLASHGYVVVGTDHTYGALAVEFPDGRIASLRTTSTPEFAEIVQIWADDMSSVLNELERRNADTGDLLFGALDLTRVGATGHSTGGSAALQVHATDDRFSAAASLDAPQVGEAADGAGLTHPGLLFFASPSDYDEGLVQARMSGPGYSVTISNTTHYSFTDLPVLLDLAGVAEEDRQQSTRPPGTIAPQTNLAIINGFTRAFFDRFFFDRPSILLEGGAEWPEAEFRIIVAP